MLSIIAFVLLGQNIDPVDEGGCDRLMKRVSLKKLVRQIASINPEAPPDAIQPLLTEMSEKYTFDELRAEMTPDCEKALNELGSKNPAKIVRDEARTILSTINLLASANSFFAKPDHTPDRRVAIGYLISQMMLMGSNAKQVDLLRDEFRAGGQKYQDQLELFHLVAAPIANAEQDLLQRMKTALSQDIPIPTLQRLENLDDKIVGAKLINKTLSIIDFLESESSLSAEQKVKVYQVYIHHLKHLDLYYGNEIPTQSSAASDRFLGAEWGIWISKSGIYVSDVVDSKLVWPYRKWNSQTP